MRATVECVVVSSLVLFSAPSMLGPAQACTPPASCTSSTTHCNLSTDLLIFNDGSSTYRIVAHITDCESCGVPDANDNFSFLGSAQVTFGPYATGHSCVPGSDTLPLDIKSRIRPNRTPFPDHYVPSDSSEEFVPTQTVPLKTRCVDPANLDYRIPKVILTGRNGAKTDTRASGLNSLLRLPNSVRSSEGRNKGIDVLCPSGKAMGDDDWEKKGAQGLFAKHQFRYDEPRDAYVCPAAEVLSYTDPGKDGRGCGYRRYRTAACAHCPLRARCEARARDAIERFPEKRRQRGSVEVAVAAALIERRGRLLLVRRREGGLLGRMWELPQTGPDGGADPDLARALQADHGLRVALGGHGVGGPADGRAHRAGQPRGDHNNFVQVDINELIENALEFTKVKWEDDAQSKGIRIRIQKALSALKPVMGSASELREVFTNLINNAVDAMPRGGDISGRSCMDAACAVITIEDTGVGIPPGIKDRIFDPFFTTKGPQSTGLGLSICYGTINRHHGTVTAESVEGEGSTFILTFAAAEHAPEGEVRKENSIPIRKEQEKARILVRMAVARASST